MQDRTSSLKSLAKDLPGRVVLVLQGGGALGSYQAGVYQALHEAGIEPDWIIGTSIGAINASLIAGNPIEDRLPRLKDQSRPRRSCGSNFESLFHQAASYVDRILWGEKPKNLPVQEPTKYQLIVNLKTARALDIYRPAVVTGNGRRGDRIAMHCCGA